MSSVSNLASKRFKFLFLTSRHNDSQHQADAMSETSSSSSSLADLTDDEVFEQYMKSMRKRVKAHRKRVQKLREKHSGSSSEDFKPTTPSPFDQEHPQSDMEPAGYADMVDFCYDLSLEMASRLDTEEIVSKWKKTKLLFKSVMEPFRKVLKQAQSSIKA